MKLTANQKRELEESLREKGALKPCLRCEHRKLHICDDVLLFDIPNEEPRELSKIPTLVLVCDSCGFLFQHALAVLKVDVGSNSINLQKLL